MQQLVLFELVRVTLRIICRAFSIICRMTMINQNQYYRSRSLSHQCDEFGFNGIQAFQYRLWVVEISLFG
jgi:hypothetical protein